ncbi:signal recognition particle protein [bacterium]|nr:signal recognition particle protein [bacterium]
MMFDGLSSKLHGIIRKVSGNATLTEDNIAEALKEIRRALLEADVNLRVVKAFMTSLKDKAIGIQVTEGVNPAQQLVKLVHDELVEVLGKENTPLNLSGTPPIIMMLGLQGSGKTTSAAKLALKFKKEGKRPLLVACDVYRPAAITQLKTLGEQIGVEVFTIDEEKNVQLIAQKALDRARENNFSPVIIDTAGRLQIDDTMMAELLLLDRAFHPCEKLLVIDAMMGQEAVNIADNFNIQLDITGVILTKLDGDSRGGSALSVSYCTNKPIKLTGNGEKIEELQDFHPARIADRILGMGDVVTLVEKAQEVFDEKQAVEFEKKMKKAEFTFNDFLNMQKQMKMLGSIESILGMLPIPGLSKDNRQMIANEGEKQLNKIQAFIFSMTPRERENPALLNSSRKKRIAKGCGMELSEINQFITQFDGMRKMMKGLSNMQEGMKKGKMPKMPKFPF